MFWKQKTKNKKIARTINTIWSPYYLILRIDPIQETQLNMSKSGTTETALGKCRFEECSVSAKALGEPCTYSPATKNGKEILYQEHAGTD